MTGRTHDLAAFTGLSLAFAFVPEPQMSLATLIAAVAANLLGGLAPDLDKPTSKFWAQIRFGPLFGKLISPILGGHRLISHSLLGLFISGYLLDLLLTSISHIILVDMHLVWWSFMIGFVSHLITDSFTKEGVPLLFPISIKFGIPPVKKLRLKTGGLVEKSLVFPGLMLANGYVYYLHYFKLLDFLKSLVG